jgi:predicted dienelactone hydrolase
MPTRKIIIFNLAAIVGSAIATISPSFAAEYIHFKYDRIKISASVKSIEKFAEQGIEDTELARLMGVMNEAQKQQLRYFLTLQPTPAQLSKLYAAFSLPTAAFDVYLRRVIESPSGLNLASDLGKIVHTPDEENGKFSIRTGLVNEASNIQGISLLRFIKNFPKDLEIDGKNLFAIIEQYTQTEKKEQALIEQLEKENKLQATSIKTESNLLPVDRNGIYKVSRRTLKMVDSSRNRQLEAELYLPTIPTAAKKSIPIIVISNGMGVKSDFLSFLAERLASHGFMTVIPERIESNHQRQKEFFIGTIPSDRGNFDPQDYPNFPRDISYVLDRLERENSTEFGEKLAVDRVGIFSYSFGAVAALNLAGAKFDYHHLQQSCDRESKLLNLSLLYQCRALELKDRSSISYRDSRIKSLFLLVPMGYHLFGTENLKMVNLPSFWQITDRDPFTPAITEQLPNYNAMINHQKYLAIGRKLGHSIKSTEDSVDAKGARAAFEGYLNTLSTAFFKVHLAEDRRFAVYLTPSYTQQISYKSFPLLFKTD